MVEVVVDNKIFNKIDKIKIDNRIIITTLVNLIMFLVDVDMYMAKIIIIEVEVVVLHILITVISQCVTCAVV